MISEFKGERGNFSVYTEGELHSVEAMVYGVEAPDVFQHQHKEPLEWRLNEKNHSPTGLEWGYGGSGPAQLAWCILRECGLTQSQVETLYMQFKADVVANLPRDGFVLTKAKIMEWVGQHGAPGN